MEVNKLALKAFYEKYSSQYLERRGSDDASIWDEAYKWEVLSHLSRQLNSFDDVTKDNASDVLDVYLKNNPQSGTLIDWREADDLRTVLKDKPNAWQVIRQLWSATPETVGQTIDTCNDMMSFVMPGKSLSPRTYSYLLAGRDPAQYPLFMQSKYDLLKEELREEDSWRSASRGGKYQLFTDACRELGQMMHDTVGEQSVNGVRVDNRFPALDGQDMLFVLEHVIRGTRYQRDDTEDTNE